VVPYYASDVKDPRRLAGLADAVFVGTVSEQAGFKIRHGQATTHFKVKVLQALKGTPAGEVVVEQEGGRDEKRNITYVVKGDRTLETGTSYILSTKFRDTENIYGVIPVYGNTRLTPDQASELSAGGTPKPVAEMRDSIAHQIPS